MKSPKNIYICLFIPWIVEVLFCILDLTLKYKNSSQSIFILLIWLQFVVTLLVLLSAYADKRTKLVGIAETTSSESDHPRYSIRLAIKR